MKNDMKTFVVSFLSLYTLKIYRMCIVKLYEDLILDTVFHFSKLWPFRYIPSAINPVKRILQNEE